MPWRAQTLLGQNGRLVTSRFVFPACQVRVVRSYVSSSFSLSSPFSFSSSPDFNCKPISRTGTASPGSEWSPRPQLQAQDRSVPCRTRTVSDCKRQIAAIPTGTEQQGHDQSACQLQAPDRSGPRRTRTATSGLK